MDSTGISFTALYTGHVWYRNGLSPRFFTSAKARLLYEASQPVEAFSRTALGYSTADMLLQRHLIMDHRIDALIKEEGISQILEIACGYSPRGYVFSRKYPHLKYIEADLPDMAEKKRHLLKQHKGFGPDHHVVACDVFKRGTPDGLDYVMHEVLDAHRPTLIITEGLVNYFTLKNISQVWSALAQMGQRFPKAWYMTDLVPKLSRPFVPHPTHVGLAFLSMATRSNVNLHFRSTKEIQQQFERCGFDPVTVHHPRDFKESLNLPMQGGQAIVRIVEAEIARKEQ